MFETQAEENIKTDDDASAGAQPPAPERQNHPKLEKLPDTLDLQHKVFRAFDDCYFMSGEEDGKVMLVIRMGDAPPFSLPVKGMVREFGIEEGSYDDQLIGAVKDALYYVNALRPGDPFPREVLTGEASWKVEDRHRQIAYNRITMQLVTWMSGSEELITDPDQLLQVAQDPGTRQKIQDAFTRVAEHLGYGRENRDKVPELVKNIAEELAYIEALRDQSRSVILVQNKVTALVRFYGTEKSLLETARQVSRLVEEAHKRFTDTFDQIDAQTGEVMSVLKNPDTQERYIRNMRDDLYKRLYAWSDIFAIWRSLKVKRSGQAAHEIRELYKFLAPRFMKVKEWALVTKAGTAGADGVSHMATPGPQAADQNMITW